MHLSTELKLTKKGIKECLQNIQFIDILNPWLKSIYMTIIHLDIISLYR